MLLKAARSLWAAPGTQPVKRSFALKNQAGQISRPFALIIDYGPQNLATRDASLFALVPRTMATVETSMGEAARKSGTGDYHEGRILWEHRERAFEERVCHGKEQSMNTEPVAPLESLEEIKSTIERRYAGAAFAAAYFDGAGEGAAVRAALERLEAAHGDCLDRKVPLAEIEDAIAFLSKRDAKAAGLAESFAKYLHHPEPAIRFEATERALRGLSRQFGR